MTGIRTQSAAVDHPMGMNELLRWGPFTRKDHRERVSHCQAGCDTRARQRSTSFPRAGGQTGGAHVHPRPVQSAYASPLVHSEPRRPVRALRHGVTALRE